LGISSWRATLERERERERRGELTREGERDDGGDAEPRPRHAMRREHEVRGKCPPETRDKETSPRNEEKAHKHSGSSSKATGII